MKAVGVESVIWASTAVTAVLTVLNNNTDDNNNNNKNKNNIQHAV